MIALILSLLLTAQAQPTGVITGVIRTTSGQPASGVRVSAMARPESLADSVTSTAFATLAQTDENGRYRLEDVPPGSYYISAGRVDLPTFYPGTLELLKGSTVSVKSSALVISGIDFVLDDASMRQPGDVTPMLGGISGLTLPVQIRMEGGAKQPVISENRLVTLRLTRLRDRARSEMPITDSIQNFPIPDPLPGNEYRVSVENLPKGYAVKSIVQDGVDLLSGTLKITAKNFASSPVSQKDLMAPGAFKDTVQFRSNAGVQMTPLEITLAASAASPANSGVRVTGRATSAGVWYPTLAVVPSNPGIPGTFFADGSFEFKCASSCGNMVLLQDSLESPTHILGAYIVVRSENLDDIRVEEVPVIPVERNITSTIAEGRQEPASSEQMPLATLRGSVIDESTKEPVLGGHVTLTGSGKTKAEFPIDNLGLFEIPRLLPGDYNLTIEGFQHASKYQSAAIGTSNVQVNVSVKAGN